MFENEFLHAQTIETGEVQKSITAGSSLPKTMRSQPGGTNIQRKIGKELLVLCCIFCGHVTICRGCVMIS